MVHGRSHPLRTPVTMSVCWSSHIGAFDCVDDESVRMVKPCPLTVDVRAIVREGGMRYSKYVFALALFSAQPQRWCVIWHVHRMRCSLWTTCLLASSCLRVITPPKPTPRKCKSDMYACMHAQLRAFVGRSRDASTAHTLALYRVSVLSHCTRTKPTRPCNLALHARTLVLTVHAHTRCPRKCRVCMRRYSYFLFHVAANLHTLNRLREARGLNTFTFRPHSGRYILLRNMLEMSDSTG